MANDYTYVYTGTGNDTADLTYGGYVPTVPSPEAAPTVFNDVVIRIGEKKEENMRGVYRIIVVNPKSGKILDPLFLLVAKDEQGALLKADLPQEVRDDPEQYDFLIDRLGDVRAKKDIQKVKVVEED